MLTYENFATCIDLEIDGERQTTILAKDCFVVGDKLVYEAKEKIRPGVHY